MSSKRKSQPTRIRDQIEDSELHASPIHSPNTQLEKGMFTPLNKPYFQISISKFNKTFSKSKMNHMNIINFS